MTRRLFARGVVLTAVCRLARPCSFSGQALSERRQRRRARARFRRRPAGAGPGPVRRLSIDEAVALALEQNVDLQVDRIDPQVQDYSISVARSSWTPAFFSNITTRNQTNPPHDIFGGDGTAITDER